MKAAAETAEAKVAALLRAWVGSQAAISAPANGSATSVRRRKLDGIAVHCADPNAKLQGAPRATCAPRACEIARRRGRDPGFAFPRSGRCVSESLPQCEQDGLLA